MTIDSNMRLVTPEKFLSHCCRYTNMMLLWSDHVLSWWITDFAFTGCCRKLNSKRKSTKCSMASTWVFLLSWRCYKYIEGLYQPWSKRPILKTAWIDFCIERLFWGSLFRTCVQINETENRSVLHAALRAPRDEVINCDGHNVVPAVWDVLDKIDAFSDQIRSGSWVYKLNVCRSQFVFYVEIKRKLLRRIFCDPELQARSWSHSSNFCILCS